MKYGYAQSEIPTVDSPNETAAALAGPIKTEVVFFPESLEAYLEKLEDFLNAEEVRAPDVHRLNARRFLYFQLYRTSLPFDRFLEPDGIWPGFVRLKAFIWQDLLPENSSTLKTISEGILNGNGFLLPED